MGYVARAAPDQATKTQVYQIKSDIWYHLRRIEAMLKIAIANSCSHRALPWVAVYYSQIAAAIRADLPRLRSFATTVGLNCK